jgi:stage V sporulation protein AA
MINKECPEVLVQSVGETDVLIEKVKVAEYKGWRQWGKVLLVCCISFFGTGFTIIAYNSEIEINRLFTRMYDVFGVESLQRVNLLELSYSVGLAAGIIIFFNHIGGRRITKDPTPIEVSIKNYERDVNQTLIETADREGMEEDV